MIEIEIDGKPLEAEQGSMIIEVADAAGIAIPRFCYHKKLSVAANCRMCLVEVEKVGKPLPACATPVTAGMKVFTCSEKARSAQQAVMEFLLINHPLDCPICDQGGECELQDVSLTYGTDVSRYTEGKRVVKDKDIGPLISTDMTRCIQCTRCVRFGQEVAGLPELGALGRGENLEIGTYIEHSLVSEMAGNVIDLCPVGALTSKPFRFTARAWELRQSPSIAPHDCMGSHVNVHTRGKDVMRVVPREQESINETWISDRDRYSYLGLKSADRVTTPLIKRGGGWHEVDWQTALDFAVESLQKTLHEHGAEQIGALASPSATLEELYLLQKFMRGMGSDHLDHRLHQTDFSDQEKAPLFPSLGINIADLSTRDAIFLIGSNVKHEQPIAGTRIRKASLEGAKIFAVNPVDFDFHFALQEKIIAEPSTWVTHLAGIAKALLTEVPAAFTELFSKITPSREEKIIAAELKRGERAAVLLGAFALNHPEASSIRALAKLITEWSGATYGCFTEGANAAGACLAGVLPHRTAAGVPVKKPGFNTQRMLTEKLKAYVLLGIEPDLDCANPGAVRYALKSAGFVLALTSFKTDNLLEYADVILPMAAFTETSGTFVNVEGRWQSFAAAVSAPDDAKPAWKILCALGSLSLIEGFDYTSSEDVRNELKKNVGDKAIEPSAIEAKAIEIKSVQHKFSAITYWPVYAGDSLVRRANALQQAASNPPAAVEINQRLADQLQLKAGEDLIVSEEKTHSPFPWVVNTRVPDNCVVIPMGDVMNIFGLLSSNVTLRRLS